MRKPRQPANDEVGDGWKVALGDRIKVFREMIAGHTAHSLIERTWILALTECIDGRAARGEIPPAGSWYWIAHCCRPGLTPMELIEMAARVVAGGSDFRTGLDAANVMVTMGLLIDEAQLAMERLGALQAPTLPARR